MVRSAPYVAPGGNRIENGSLATVIALDARRDGGTIRLTDESRQVTPDLAPLRRGRGDGDRTPALRLAYAMHPNPAQGATVARSAVSSHPVADRHATHVTDTRAIYAYTVHLARKELGSSGTDDGAPGVGLLPGAAEVVAALRGAEGPRRSTCSGP